MGALKNAFHDEIVAAADDKRHDEFDCYEARLHSLLSDLDWIKGESTQGHAPAEVWGLAAALQLKIKDMMK